MAPRASAEFQRAYRELRRWGLLLLTDARLPSVASLAAGEPVRGSWWAHPKAHAIWHVLVRLSQNREIIATKLLSGKVTFVHRKLWPALERLGSARESWQLAGLSRGARSLLNSVTRRGELRTDQVRRSQHAWQAAPAAAARELERRLLVYSEEIHTPSGAHAKRLETWERWAKRVGLPRAKMTAEQAKRQLEKIAASLNAQFHAQCRLPWQTK